jgi:hypothetical protein
VTVGVQIPEQHAAFAPGSLGDYFGIAAYTTWYGGIFAALSLGLRSNGYIIDPAR